MKIKTQNQSGRSMVEMLGVLAVIGVLSSAGIYGYSYAMDQYKYNTYLKLIDTVAMSVAIENGKGADSIFLSGMNGDIEGSLKWCSSYGTEWCAKQKENGESFHLTPAESGATSNGKTGVSGVYWAISSGSKPSYCTCSTDISFRISNLKSSTCNKLVEHIYHHDYINSLIAFSGKNIAPTDDLETTKQNICKRDTLNEITTFVLIFEGPITDNMQCGTCLTTCKSWGICE